MAAGRATHQLNVPGMNPEKGDLVLPTQFAGQLSHLLSPFLSLKPRILRPTSLSLAPLQQVEDLSDQSH